MKKIHIILIFILFGLLISNAVPAEREKQPRNKITHTISADQAAESHNKDIEIAVQNDGEQIIVDATFTVPVKPQRAWETLTDFDNVSNFMTSVQSSKIINRTGNTLHVSQKSIIKFSFLTFSFKSVRKINLFPFKKIQERMISGSVREMEETTLLLPEGDQTRIIYHASIIPDVWGLIFVGEIFIEYEVREQFQELIEEIFRREQVGYQQGVVMNTPSIR